MTDLDFIHHYEPGKSERTLLLLHGTGGNEHDLIDLGHAIDPEAALLSPRGKVMENGAARFFRRLAEGVFDEADVVRRAKELGQFVESASIIYKIDPNQLVAVGYSNGANIAAAMMLLGVAPFRNAILLRPMVPLSKVDTEPNLNGTKALLSGGKFDPIARVPIVEALAELMSRFGATVTTQIREGGHGLTMADVMAAREWLA